MSFEGLHPPPLPLLHTPTGGCCVCAQEAKAQKLLSKCFLVSFRPVQPTQGGVSQSEKPLLERSEFSQCLRNSLAAFYSTAPLTPPPPDSPRQASHWLITQEVLPHSHFLHFRPNFLLILKKIPSTSPPRCHCEPLSLSSRGNAAEAGSLFPRFPGVTVRASSN